MNQYCKDLIFSDATVSMLCKSWIWMYENVFCRERFRRWRGHPHYPFYSEIYIDCFQIPVGVNGNGDDLDEFYSCCEHWFDCVCQNQRYEIIAGLPHSGEGGLGLVSKHRCHLYDLYEDISGVLEFVTDEMFLRLRNNGFNSLYETREHDRCILFGPLSLCNNSTLLSDYWPSFIDRNYETDVELEYHGLRRSYTAFPHAYDFIPFSHFSVRMHITQEKDISVGEQIYMNYLSDNFIDLTAVP